MLVYMAVLILVVGALVTTFLSLDTVFIRNKTDRELTHAATVSLERIVRTIKDADSVDTGLSTLGSSPGVLVLESGTTTTRFYVSSSTLVVSKNGTVVGPLTSDEVQVDRLVFQRYTNSETELVRVSLTVSNHSKAASSTRTFYASAVIRGTYD